MNNSIPPGPATSSYPVDKLSRALLAQIASAADFDTYMTLRATSRSWRAACQEPTAVMAHATQRITSRPLPRGDHTETAFAAYLQVPKAIRDGRAQVTELPATFAGADLKFSKKGSLLGLSTSAPAAVLFEHDLVSGVTNMTPLMQTASTFMRPCWMSPSGQYGLATFDNGKSVLLWDFHVAGPPRRLPDRELSSALRLYYAFDFSPDEQHVAGVGANGDVHVWDSRTGHKEHYMHHNIHFPKRVRFSQDGSMLIVASPWGSHVYSLATHGCTAVLPKNDRASRALIDSKGTFIDTWHPGQSLAAAYDMALFPGERLMAALTPDGLQLVDRTAGSHALLPMSADYHDRLQLSDDGTQILISGHSPKLVDFLAPRWPAAGHA